MPGMSGSSSYDVGSGLLGLLNMSGAPWNITGPGAISDPFGAMSQVSPTAAKASGLFGQITDSMNDEEVRKRQLFQQFMKQLSLDMALKKAVQFGNSTPITPATRQVVPQQFSEAK